MSAGFVGGWGYFRPYWDKVAGIRPGRFPAFVRELSELTDDPVAVWFPKFLWGMARGFQQHEFRFYRLHGMSWRRLATYHSTIDNVRLIERLNSADKLPLLRDKGLFLKRFAHRIGRETLDLREASVEAFAEFVARHPCFLAKAYNLAFGAGIEVFDAPVSDVAGLCARLAKEGKFVIEEFLRQHDALNAVYDRSVNTLRIYTLLGESGPEVVFPPTVRFGSAGGRIDSAGIVTVLVDPDSGEYLAGGVNRQGRLVAAHPDTAFPFANLVVPQMAEAVALVKAAAAEIPEVRYVGWDVAVTPGGPVLVEGNGAPSVATVQWLLASRDADGCGCRRWLGELGAGS